MTEDSKHVLAERLAVLHTRLLNAPKGSREHRYLRRAAERVRKQLETVERRGARMMMEER